MHQISLQAGKKIYFASDFHFGIPDHQSSRQREKKICSWLSDIASDAQYIFLLGDIFDSWMEYKRVVPKGYTRFLGKLAELADAGIGLVIFTGNHDLWMHGYFEEQFNAQVFRKPQTFKVNDAIFHLAHGDGLSDQEKKYRFMKSVLHHPISQFLYRQLHPDLGLRLADFFSRLGPKHKYQDLAMKSDEKEYQLIYAKEKLAQSHYDYFIFGHRHIPLMLKLNDSSTFINLGDWLSYDTFAVFDGRETLLLKY